MGNNYVLILLQQGYVKPLINIAFLFDQMIFHLCHCFLRLFYFRLSVFVWCHFFTSRLETIAISFMLYNTSCKLARKTCPKDPSLLISVILIISDALSARDFLIPQFLIMHVAWFVFWCTRLIKVAICKDLSSGFRAILQQYC